MSERSSIFDMIGPVMIGPSSSHTAGVVRIGRVARKLLQAQPEWAQITFYNSFAATYEGHGSDRAVLAGLMDMKTDDDRIRTALELAHQAGIDFRFRSVAANSKLHPNSLRIEARAGDHSVDVVGISRGGGLITIREVDGFHANFTAQLYTVLIHANDAKGSIAFITDVIAHDDCNIATMNVSRKGKNREAMLIMELDSGLRPLTVDYLRSLNWVRSVIYVPDIDL